MQEAQSSKAPFVRLADRYALIFLPLTLILAALAWWWSGDPVRALAVLVVATPCPLILAAPVAIVAGLSRCASRGIIVKGGAPLEALGRAYRAAARQDRHADHRTPGAARRARLGAVPADEILRLAASLDQVSPHVFAAAIGGGGAAQGVAPARLPHCGARTPRRGGIEGESRTGCASRSARSPGSTRTGRSRQRCARCGAARRSRAPRASGWRSPTRPRRRSCCTIRSAPTPARHPRPAPVGNPPRRDDHRRPPEVAETVGFGLGADLVLAERSPAEKVEAVRNESRRGTTVMVGDGLNDAPALAAANVGVAMGARGATALGAGRRRRVDGRPPRSSRRGDGDRPPLARHRPAERRGRHGPLAAWR